MLARRLLTTNTMAYISLLAFITTEPDPVLVVACGWHYRHCRQLAGIRLAAGATTQVLATHKATDIPVSATVVSVNSRTGR